MYVPLPDINTHLKSNYLSVPTLINTCMVSQSNYNECLNSRLWISAFVHDNLPIYTPYPTTIQQWIKRYDATVKTMKILNMHQLFISHFAEYSEYNKRVVDRLVISDLHHYGTINNIPLPQSIMYRIHSNATLIQEAVILLYPESLYMELTPDFDEEIQLHMTYDEMLNMLINMVENGQDIHEINGLPFNKKELKLYNDDYYSHLTKWDFSSAEAVKILYEREKLAL